MSTSVGHLALGLDIGGSSVKTALLRLDGSAPPETVNTDLFHLDQSREPGLVVGELARITTQLRTQYGPIASVGVGIPGMFDEAAGTPTLLPNFPISWKGFPFRQEVEGNLGQKIALVNDAKAFSLAESVVGSAAGLETVVCVVLGTGVGGGVVHRGKVWKGLGSAGELGHLTVELDGPPCGCGNNGCVESFASSAAISTAGGQESVQAVFAAAATGDTRAQVAIDRAIKALGAGLANVFITLAPDTFVIGGGVAGAGKQLIAPLEAEIRRRIRVAPGTDIHVVPASLGRHAGAIGAALMGAGTQL
ncbi:ROK family protein [Paenarthrobacter sp. OM7]|uniref:ROK family protein n=1 Tax=Paenarthrobacter sp. OM7 TaxID=3041264 RepID=UPI0024689FE5|nr:ROK family protein [Paenarthrobacter sp. OM7]WGM20295.1 ROK family protein [Paenarthrobacter sp. OM7]